MAGVNHWKLAQEWLCPDSNQFLLLCLQGYLCFHRIGWSTLPTKNELLGSHSVYCPQGTMTFLTILPGELWQIHRKCLPTPWGGSSDIICCQHWSMHLRLTIEIPRWGQLEDMLLFPLLKLVVFFLIYGVCVFFVRYHSLSLTFTNSNLDWAILTAAMNLLSWNRLLNLT